MEKDTTTQAEKKIKEIILHYPIVKLLPQQNGNVILSIFSLSCLEDGKLKEYYSIPLTFKQAAILKNQLTDSINKTLEEIK
jgi:hypothetical protein